jgi:outer membrane biogenesis lipoprotein LolB
MNTRKAMTMAAAVAAAVFLAGCTELAQEPARSYAGKEDAKAYAGDQFKGDKQKWEAALAARANHQNDYLRSQGAK